jgi:hypothetical protein
MVRGALWASYRGRIWLERGQLLHSFFVCSHSRLAACAISKVRTGVLLMLPISGLVFLSIRGGLEKLAYLVAVQVYFQGCFSSL